MPARARRSAPAAGREGKLQPHGEAGSCAPRVPKAERNAAENACFKYLKGLNMKPLSEKALAAARVVVADDGRCIAAHGYRVGRPVAGNMSRGRAFFGFDRPAVPLAGTNPSAARLTDVTRACERQVDMAKRLDKIIAADRADTRGNL